MYELAITDIDADMVRFVVDQIEQKVTGLQIGAIDLSSFLELESCVPGHLQPRRLMAIIDQSAAIETGMRRGSAISIRPAHLAECGFDDLCAFRSL